MAYKHALPAKQTEELIIDILNIDLTAGYKNVYKTQSKAEKSKLIIIFISAPDYHTYTLLSRVISLFICSD